MEAMEAFIELLMKNLHKNSFPERRVSFDLEGLYERAEDRRLSLNNVLDELKERGVDHVKRGDKIIFFEIKDEPELDFSGLSPDFLERAQEMMKGMNPDDLSVAEKMARERLQTMSPEERAKLWEQMKGLGL